MEEGIRKLIRKSLLFIRKTLDANNKNLAFYLLIFFSFLVFVIGINFFIELTEDLAGSELQNFDEEATDYIISFRTPARTSFFQFITDLGDLNGYLIATFLVGVLFFLKLRNWKIILQLVGVTILAALSNVALKRAIDRARPTIEHLVVVKTLSYPSGHAMSAMAFYGFLIYLVSRIQMSRLLRAILILLFIFLILSIGISRIYLGVHFPSDVVGGYIAGLIWVAFCIIVFNIIDLLRLRRRRKRKDVGEDL